MPLVSHGLLKERVSAEWSRWPGSVSVNTNEQFKVVSFKFVVKYRPTIQKW